MLNIVIPMAGRGSRFADAGYTVPKPLIEVNGIPMIKIVIDNLKQGTNSLRFVFLCLEDLLKKSDIREQLCEWAGMNSVVVPVHGVTQGAACTVLLAKDVIDNDEPLVIANCDQIVSGGLGWLDTKIDNGRNYIMTMKVADKSPKWSYVEIDNDENILRVVEKQPISDMATIGVYHFRKGSLFVRYAMQMIREDFRVRGEFYVAPVYDWLIKAGLKVKSFCVGKEGKEFFGLGTPEDLARYISK